MRIFDSNLAAHLAGEVVTLALCVRLTRTDGVQFGFTAHNRDLMVAGLLYKASDSLLLSSLESSGDTRPSNADVQGVLSDARITAEDIHAGLYDGAVLEIFLLNWESPPVVISPQTVVWLHSGSFGCITQRGDEFTAELWGLAKALERQVPELLTPTCRAQKLGDARCKVNVNVYTHNLTISSVASERSLTHSGAAFADGYFTYGTLKVLSTGREEVIKNYVNGVITLQSPLALTVGASITLVRGCDRRFATCRDVFNNSVNFRGEPPHLLPGSDKLAQPL